MAERKNGTLTPTSGDGPRGLRGWVLRQGVERALKAQQPLVTARIAAIRRKKPNATPAEVITTLGRQYRTAVALTGAGGGALAIVPALGTVASLATATTEAVATLDAAVLYTLAVAEVHALPTDEPQRRQAIVLGVVVGQGAQEALQKLAGRSRGWAEDVTDRLPIGRLGALNAFLVRWFAKRFLIRQGTLALGRALPLGIGVAIGVTGNLAIARAVIRSAEQAFGPPPATWPGHG
ncbi:hypothetical protein [Pseudonocardia endophytica]|uniref:EcsC family protein n=1 Tax=Pseudonocardia endophytica TaxID=401976 RepID=A0A4R1HSR4_PSEEN|nr:hypothetical protein [Pseudonocardia endophytica]TCK25218.1 hypothetical protein EV378_1018 [Pseudonocardia endophytica]